MSRTYVPKERDSGIMFIIYDYQKNQYDLWQLSANEPQKLFKNIPDAYIDSIYIAITSTFIDELTQAEPPMISVVNFQDRTKMIEALYDYNMLSASNTEVVLQAASNNA